MLGRAAYKNDEARIAELEAELDCGEFPEAITHLWTSFRRIRRRKGSNGFAASPIEWPDIDAFMRNTKVRLAPWELEIIEDLDDLFLAEHARASKNRTSQDK